MTAPLVPVALVEAASELAQEARARLPAGDAAAELLDRALVVLALGQVAGAVADLRAAGAALHGDVDRAELVEAAVNLLDGRW